MSTERIITASLLVIGDEILSGRTKDKNIGHIAEQLDALGIELKEVRIVADDEGAIIHAVQALSPRYTYLFTTGGIGPTHDDITADSIAKAMGVGIDVDPRALEIMRPHYERRGLEMTAPRLRMARIPYGAELIPNAVSATPGFMIGNVIVMAGVPAVMQAMLSEVCKRLETGSRVQSQSIDLTCPEGEIAELFAEHQNAYPDVLMGSYPRFVGGGYRTQLVLRSRDVDCLAKATEGLKAKLAGRGLL